MKKLVFLILALATIGSSAQKWQAQTDQMWGNYCYRENGERFLDALTSNTKMTRMPTDNNIRLAYYWRIPKGNVKALVTWTNNYARFASMNVVLTRPATGDTLAVNQIANDKIASTTREDDLFGTVNFPADDFYRVEITSEAWNYIKDLQYFTFYRESEDPVLIPRNFGGTSAHMFGFSSTDPQAPAGAAYDWAYVECMAPSQYLCPGTYFMTMGPMNSYMGMQTSGVVGDDFNKSVLFSVWDNGSTDEDPNLALYLQSRVMDGNASAVHTHAGGEGSSASVMFKDKTTWWRPDHWVQFLLNTRPETVHVTVKTKDGRDSTFDYENIIMTTWYKVDTMPEWRYMATIRSSGQQDLISSWYCFIEPFTSYAGQKLHRVFYRNAMMRSANSGVWYSRNQVGIGHDKYGRDFHYDFGRGATQEYPGAFFLDMGAYVAQHDSATVIPLVTDKTCVDTIDTDRLLHNVEAAILRDSRLDHNWALNETAPAISGKTWSIITGQSTSGSVNGTLANTIDDNASTIWSSTSGFPYRIALRAEEEQVVSSFDIYWENKYSWRTRCADIYTSDDGENWTLAFDSLEIRCEDYTKVIFPHALKTKYLRLNLYKGWDTSNLSINSLTLRGDYDLEKVKAIAKEQIDKAGSFTYYPEEALAEVKKIYQDGNCTEAQPLVSALRDLYNNNMPLNYSRLKKTIQISTARAYNLQNMNGYGMLCATPDGRLTTAAATAAGSKPEFTGKLDVCDSLANWLILHDERYTGYYLYNIGAHKFVNLDAENMLSDMPQAFTMRANGRGFYFTAGNDAVGVNSTVSEGAVKANGNTSYSQFFVYDNFEMRQSTQLRDSLMAIVEPAGKLDLYKRNIAQMINAPVGVVGGFTSEQARAALQAAYDNADANPQAFIDAVENADIVAFDPDNTVYNLRAVSETLAQTPYLTSDPTLRLYTKAANNAYDQIFRFSTRNYGYSIHSQGTSLKPASQDAGHTIVTTADPSQRGTYVLDEQNWGTFCIGPAQNCSAMINGNFEPVKTTTKTTDGALWYIEPCTSTAITMNAVGMAGFYADFAIVAPEGLKVYAINHVTGDGVIKLTELHGVIPAGVAVILRGDSYQKYELTVLNSTNKLEESNLLQGVYSRTTNLQKGTFYTLTTSAGNPVMKKPAISLVAANNVYLPCEEGMPELDTYTFDFDNLVDAVTSATTDQPSANNAATYTIDGRKAPATVKGNIYIRNRQKVLE